MSDATLIPAQFADITPSDATYLDRVIGLYVGGAGTVKAQGQDGVTGTFVCAAGQYLTGAFKRVLATGTTATSIVALKAN